MCLTYTAAVYRILSSTRSVGLNNGPNVTLGAVHKRHPQKRPFLTSPHQCALGLGLALPLSPPCDVRISVIHVFLRELPCKQISQ